MRKLFLVLVSISFLIVSCTAHYTNEISELESEVRRLADENFTLRKELIELTENTKEYKNTIDGLESSLELAQQNQSERFQEFYNFNNDLIIQLAKTHKTNELIEFTSFKEEQYSSDIYGEAIYEEMLNTGLEKFIEILELKKLSVIDDVTNLLIKYVNDNNQAEDLLDLLKKIKYEEGTNKKYIVEKLEYWINEKK